MTRSKPIYGLILSGGKSSRMSHDKGLISYHGKPQREYLFEMLKLFCEDVFFSCKTTTDIPLSLNPLADQYHIESPLNGILTAFHHNPAVAWLTVPVDMPLINVDTLLHLLNHRKPNTIATCFYDDEGVKPEPLLTLWEPNAYPDLKSFYESGNISPRKFLTSRDVNVIQVPDRKMLTNINSQDDLNKFKN